MRTRPPPTVKPMGARVTLWRRGAVVNRAPISLLEEEAAGFSLACF